MLFNSPEFLLGFLPLTLGLFFLLQKFRLGGWSALLLLGASLVFYAGWSLAYVPLLLASIAVNFCFGLLLMRRPAKAILALAVAFNLGLLGYFKYAAFAVQTVDAGLGLGLVTPQIILPLGISFYTFTQIAFLVDAYKGKVIDKDPVQYALFVTFFPHLIAGPILHHREMTDQFRRFPTVRVTGEDLAVGATIFVIGLFKKLALADQFAPFAGGAFDAAAAGHDLTAARAWGGALSYTLQLYFDFSGYSDMAIGLARLVGVKMPENFNSPYKALSIADFWTRWHMTLSRFLRDYLYIPLGGNRKGMARSDINVFATMLLGGLWHGAGWTFVLWGAMHGAFIVVGRFWERWAAPRGIRMPALAAGAITFMAVLLAWVPFRAADMDAAAAMYRAMAGVGGLGVPDLKVAALCAVGLLVVWLAPNTQELMRRYDPVITLRPLDGSRAPAWRFTPRFAVALAAAGVLSLLLANDVSEFLYFQF